MIQCRGYDKKPDSVWLQVHQASSFNGLTPSKSTRLMPARNRRWTSVTTPYSKHAFLLFLTCAMNCKKKRPIRRVGVINICWGRGKCLDDNVFLCNFYLIFTCEFVKTYLKPAYRLIILLVKNELFEGRNFLNIEIC